MITLHPVQEGWGTGLFSPSFSFTLNAGEKVAVVGPNGSGKTTLIRALVRRLAGRVGYVPQHPEPVAMTVGDYVMLGRTRYLSPWHAPTAADEAAVAEALTVAGLAGWERRRVETLSGGERQCAAWALACATGAPYMVLDEPTAHLDATRRASCFAWLARSDKTICAVVHDAAIAERVFTRVVRLG